MKKNIRLISILCLAICLLTSGCSFNLYSLPDLENHILEDAYREDASVYRTLYSSEVVSLNYLTSESLVDAGISANVIDSLLDYDAYGNQVPGLAESMEVNNNLTQWTFHLRDDITWVDYNGNYYADVVADDWVCATEQGIYPENMDAPIAKATALDDKTLVYTLDIPCPFFPSVLSYAYYLPVCRKYLEKTGSMFAKDYKNLLYNGAYILHYYQPFEKQVLVKNPTYWDKDNVHIDRVENYFDYDATDISTEGYLSGSVDKAIIPYDKLYQFMEDEELADNIHRTRPDNSVSYFYAFNFNPQFDKKYEPDNWAKAVANENFRKAIMASIDRRTILSIYEPYNPDILLNNTLTPSRALFIEGKDYTSLDALSSIAQKDSYNISMSKYYRKMAKKELSEAGATFPIKILMPYDPSVEGWEKEATKVELQIEAALGRNFVDVVVEAGSSTGFEMSVIQSGKFALTKCSATADYYDPLTFIEPLIKHNKCTFWDKSDSSDIQALNTQWESLIQKAVGITSNYEKRYSTFAEAEHLVIEHAIIIPFSIMNGDGYIMCKLNEFEGEYAHYGIAHLRYKGLTLHEKSMNLNEYNKAYQEWLRSY